MFKRFYRRRFLNRRGFHAGAYVIADCSVRTWDDGTYVRAELSIADCADVAVLSFGHEADDRAAARNALYKAHTLKAVLDDFVVALEEAQEVAAARAKPTVRS